jgi:hypothetical protein
MPINCPICARVVKTSDSICPQCSQPNPVDLAVRMLRKELAASKLDAIRFVRGLVPGLGLAEAKKLIEAIEKGESSYPETYSALDALAIRAGHLSSLPIISNESDTGLIQAQVDAKPSHNATEGFKEPTIEVALPQPPASEDERFQHTRTGALSLSHIASLSLDTDGFAINNRSVSPLPNLGEFMQVVGTLNRGGRSWEYNGPGINVVKGNMFVGGRILFLQIWLPSLVEWPTTKVCGTILKKDFSLSDLLGASSRIKWDVSADGRSAVLSSGQANNYIELKIYFTKDQQAIHWNITRKLSPLQKVVLKLID